LLPALFSRLTTVSYQPCGCYLLSVYCLLFALCSLCSAACCQLTLSAHCCLLCAHCSLPTAL
jgi:hypothetical protein